MRRIDEQGAFFFCENWFAALEGNGWTDPCRRQHGLKVREYSWFSNWRIEFRIDHVFGSASTVPQARSCTYDYSTREAARGQSRMTDHSAITVELKGWPLSVIRKDPADTIGDRSVSPINKSFRGNPCSFN